MLECFFLSFLSLIYKIKSEKAWSSRTDNSELYSEKSVFMRLYPDPKDVEITSDDKYQIHLKMTD